MNGPRTQESNRTRTLLTILAATVALDIPAAQALAHLPMNRIFWIEPPGVKSGLAATGGGVVWDHELADMMAPRFDNDKGAYVFTLGTCFSGGMMDDLFFAHAKSVNWWNVDLSMNSAATWWQTATYAGWPLPPGKDYLTEWTKGPVGVPNPTLHQISEAAIANDPYSPASEWPQFAQGALTGLFWNEKLDPGEGTGYAVLWAGGPNRIDAEETKGIFELLRFHGYAAENIYVLYKDGAVNPRPFPAIVPVNYMAATKGSLRTVIDPNVGGGGPRIPPLGAKDILVFWAADHGTTNLRGRALRVPRQNPNAQEPDWEQIQQGRGVDLLYEQMLGKCQFEEYRHAEILDLQLQSVGVFFEPIDAGPLPSVHELSHMPYKGVRVGPSPSDGVRVRFDAPKTMVSFVIADLGDNGITARAYNAADVLLEVVSSNPDDRGQGVGTMDFFELDASGISSIEFAPIESTLPDDIATLDVLRFYPDTGESVGACCLPDGTCVKLSEPQCALAEGSFGGDGVSCDAVQCTTRGACCLPDGACQLLSEAECDALSGAYGGDGTFCFDDLVPTSFIDDDFNGPCLQWHLEPTANTPGFEAGFDSGQYVVDELLSDTEDWGRINLVQDFEGPEQYTAEMSLAWLEPEGALDHMFDVRLQLRNNSTRIAEVGVHDAWAAGRAKARGFVHGGAHVFSDELAFSGSAKLRIDVSQNEDDSWHFVVSANGEVLTSGDSALTPTRVQIFVRQNWIWPFGSVSIDRCRIDVPDPCPGDLDGDGAVNAADLAILLGDWGHDPASDADLTGDGFVNAADLAVLLGAWGDCPQ